MLWRIVIIWKLLGQVHLIWVCQRKWDTGTQSHHGYPQNHHLSREQMSLTIIFVWPNPCLSLCPNHWEQQHLKKCPALDVPTMLNWKSLGCSMSYFKGRSESVHPPTEKTHQLSEAHPHLWPSQRKIASHRSENTPNTSKHHSIIFIFHPLLNHHVSLFESPQLAGKKKNCLPGTCSSVPLIRNLAGRQALRISGRCCWVFLG